VYRRNHDTNIFPMSVHKRRSTRKKNSDPRLRKKLTFKTVLPTVREETTVVIPRRKRKREEDLEQDEEPVSNISYVLTQILKLNRQLFTVMESVKCLGDTVRDLSDKVGGLEEQIMYGSVRETVGIGRSLQDHFNTLETCTLK